ncbi:MAG: hypothetical protein V4693_11890 [Pseudomonadota bacterium]
MQGGAVAAWLPPVMALDGGRIGSLENLLRSALGVFPDFAVT